LNPCATGELLLRDHRDYDMAFDMISTNKNCFSDSY